MWAIVATIETSKGRQGYRGSIQVPTFYLNENVQGIVSKHMAKEIAADILSSANPALILGVNLWITAERV